MAREYIWLWDVQHGVSISEIAIREGLDIQRVRIGVGRPDSTDPEQVAAYVLGKFRESKPDVEALIDSAADAAMQLLS